LKRGGGVEVEEGNEEFDYKLTGGYLAWFLVRIEKGNKLDKRGWA
jgi:hypothetical protein